MPWEQDYQRLLSSTPARRLNPAKLGESGVLKNKLVETISFLENLAVKDSAEKDMFFKRLPAAVPQLPLPVAQLKLLPMLAGSMPLSVMMGSVMSIGPINWCFVILCHGVYMLAQNVHVHAHG